MGLHRRPKWTTRRSERYFDEDIAEARRQDVFGPRVHGIGFLKKSAPRVQALQRWSSSFHGEGLAPPIWHATSGGPLSPAMHLSPLCCLVILSLDAFAGYRYCANGLK
jgi:hypothetical protein